MRYRAFLFSLVALALVGGLLATATPASAQATSGKVTGVTTDAQTGEPLAGVQVYLEGTGLGAITADNGRYFIINVPPATYTVVAEVLGYQTYRVENVVVVINSTRTLDFQLTPQAIAVEEIRVEVEATPLVELNTPGSQDLISSEQLQSLPVNTVEEALELKQGFFTVPDNENILAFTEKSRGITPVRIRGGRNGETVTLVDGIPINNFIFGGAAFSLTKAAVGQLTFKKGGLSAMYGNALSGVVDIATKEPTSELVGSFEYQTSKLAGALGSTPDELNDFDFLEGYLSGPIPATNDKLRFLFAGRNQSAAARVLQFDDDVFDPSNPPGNVLNQPLIQDVFGGWRSFGYDDERQFYAKLQYLFTPSTKLSFSYIDETRQYQRYDFDFLLTYDDPLDSPIINSQADSLFVDGFDEKDIALGSVQANRKLFVGAFSQVIGRTFLNVNAGIFKQDRLNCNFFQGICLEDNFSDTNFNQQFVASGITVDHPTAGTDLFYGGEDITTYVLRADVQSQVSDHHNVAFGAFADLHDLTFDEKTNESTNDIFVVNQKYIAKPWDAAVYVQDRIEYDFINIDLGLRFDFGKAGGLFFADPLDPTNGTTAREVCENPGDFGPVVDPVTGETVTPDANWTLLSCSEPAIRDEAAIIAYADDFEESSTRTQVSPRLGISFPVTTNSSVFFNYGINTQNPLMNNIFQNTSIGTEGEALPCGLRGVASRSAIANAQCGPIIFSDQFAASFLGNPNLLIEKTSTYELGYLANISDNYALQVILFNKDQYGLTGVRTGGGIQDIGATYGTSSPNYQVLVNEDFQTVRGVEVGLRRRLADYWAFDLNYSYSQARTNAAPPEREFQSRAEEGDPTIRREIRSEIDLPHWFNGVLTFMAGEAAPASWLKHSSLSLSAQLRSGVPYTPTTTFGGIGENNQLERNSGTGPTFQQVNLRAQKGVRFGGVVYSFFMLVNNLFDTKNCLQPYPTTGNCDAGARDQDRRRQGNTVGENVSSTYFDRPHLFGTRREINFGMRLDF